MNTAQLESFIQVAENLNFARAAEILNITQSAVSRQIHSLEEELGTKLLHRTTRTVTLTPAGLRFLEDAKSVMGRLKIATARIQRDHGVDVQVLSIGCGNDADLDLLCRVLKSCKAELPQLHPFVRVIPHRSILNLFYQGEIDLLFGFKDDIPSKEGMVYRELFQIPVCCALSKGHPYSGKSEITEQELYSESIVTCNSYSIPSKAAAIQDQISQHTLPECTYICESFQVLLTLIRAGYGCSILPRLNYMTSEISYVPLKNTAPLSYGFFYKRGSVNSILKNFISIVNDTVIR
ncbi:MAG: LysR family transcriptional regulator [Eubacteriales bacterium]|nr:LysR family transcriptional regulator [Eubacteriales bacterium]